MARERKERRSAAVGKNDVFIAVHLEEALRKAEGCNPNARSEIEISWESFNCVMFKAKDMTHLKDNFDGPWTEGAQYKISHIKKWWYRNRYTYALAYRGELMDALEHVNKYLGGHITFINDDLKSFVGPDAEAAGTGEKRVTGHSGRCFIVGLAKFST
ncbi:unnamed protein product [Urochloa decumbens]|uniref:Uncharacterized protein n=1 Tax=Urochloa decumbens TaxID=240449 RepID=A0ABC9BKH9_9POAL